MEIRDLRYFAEIARQKSYTKAAKKLFVSQPTLSKAMKALEHRLGFELFEHGGRGLFLTRNGEILLDQARDLLDHYDQIMIMMDDLRDRNTNTITVCSTPVVSVLFLSRIILEFQKLHPEISLDVQERGFVEGCNAVAEGRSQIAIESNESITGDLTHELIYRDEMLAVFPKSNPLSGREYVTFEDIRDQQFFLYSNNYYTHNLIVEQCRKAGYTPHICITHADSEFLLNVLDSPKDMAILPAPYLKEHKSDRYTFVPFRPYLKWELALVFKKDRQLPPSTQEFVKCLKEKFAGFQKDSSIPL